MNPNTFCWGSWTPGVKYYRSDVDTCSDKFLLVIVLPFLPYPWAHFLHRHGSEGAVVRKTPSYIYGSCKAWTATWLHHDLHSGEIRGKCLLTNTQPYQCHYQAPTQ